MMTTRAGRVFKVLVFSLVVAAISRGEAVLAATLPVVTGQGAIVNALRTPTGLALGTGGSVYVSDTANQGVIKFSSAGKFVQKVPFKGVTQGIAVTSDGRLLVSLKDSVAIFDVTGKEIGKLGSGVGQFVRASDITLDDAGLIYVVDSKGGCVQVFTNGGAYLSRFGVKGSGDGQFKYPTAIAFEKLNRQLAVVDSLNGRVQFYGLNGVFLRSVGALGTGPLKFMHPQGVAFEYDTAGSVRMYVSDSMLKKIQAIDPTGSGMFISYLNDSHDNQAIPSELAFDQTLHRLYVINGQGGISYYDITDGSVVVNNTSAPAAGNATVFASAARPTDANVSLVSESGVAPFILSTVADGSTVTGEVLDVTGSVTGAATVMVNGQAVTISNGFFSTAVQLAAGANEITTTVTDNAGKSWKDVRTITRDAGAPLVTINSADVVTTDNVLMHLKGTTDRGAYVTVAGIPADLNKLTWSSTVTLAPGLNTIEVEAIDLNGQVASSKRTVIYKPAAPELAVTNPAEDLLTAKKRLTIKGVVSSSADTTVTADVNGVPRKVTVAAGQISLPVDFTREGAYTITLYAAAAGGEVSTVSRTVIYRAVK